MRTLCALWLLVAIPACTKRNPAVCCETTGECATVGFSDPQPCAEGACVLNTCVPVGCDGPEDCTDAARPLCVANQCEAPAPEPEAPDWVTRHGGTGYERGRSIAAAANGDLVATGTFSGTITLGGDVMVAPGANNAWVARYRKDGTLLWSVVLGDGPRSDGRLIAVDAAGDVYVSGTFIGPANFGGGIRSQRGGGFLVKLAGGDGRYVWERLFDSAPWSAIAVAEPGIVALRGRFQGTFDVGGQTRTSTPIDGYDGIVAAYESSEGALLWANTLVATWDDEYDAGLVAVGGDVVVAGGFSGTAMLGGEPLVAMGSVDLYLARYRGRDGSHVWSIREGTNGGRVEPLTIAAGASRVFVGGLFFDSVLLGGRFLATPVGYGAFVASYDASDGSPLWGQAFQSDQGPRTTSIASDGNKLSVAIEISNETLIIGDRTITAVSRGVVITGLDPDRGTPTPAATLFGNPLPSNTDSSSIVLTYSQDRLAGVGWFSGIGDLLGTRLNSLGSDDIAMFRVDF